MKTARDPVMLMRMKGLMRWSAITAIALFLTGCSTVVVQQPPTAAGRSHPGSVAAAAASYTVVKGDTLYSIAFRNGTDFREVARINNIAQPYTIWPGQVLKLPGHGLVATHAAPPPVVKVSQRKPVFQTVSAAHTTTTAQQPVHASSMATAASVAPPSNTSVSPPPTATTVVPVSANGSTRTVAGVKWRWPASGSVISRFQANAAIPGIDIAGKEGEPVVAAADGVVVYSGNGLVGYGELIIIKHNDSFLSAYGHNRKRLVTEGQQVKAGQEIAEMGSSGSPRDELQFQIRKDGSPVDPLAYLPSR